MAGTYKIASLSTPKNALNSQEGGISALHVIELSSLQPPKATIPMLVTLLGIVTEVKPLQPEKAPLPMLVTLLGIVTEVKP